MLAYNNFWWAVLGMGLGAFLIKYSFVYASGRMEMSDLFKKLIANIPAAVLPALILPALVYQGVAPGFHLDNPRLVAGIVAAFVAWFTRNTLATILAGMTSLWIIKAVMDGVNISGG